MTDGNKKTTQQTAVQRYKISSHNIRMQKDTISFLLSFSLMSLNCILCVSPCGNAFVHAQCWQRYPIK